MSARRMIGEAATRQGWIVTPGRDPRKDTLDLPSHANRIHVTYSRSGAVLHARRVAVIAPGVEQHHWTVGAVDRRKAQRVIGWILAPVDVQ